MKLDIKAFQQEAHDLAVSMGWYESRDLTDDDVRESMLALIHSEIAEALECIRKPDPIWLTMCMVVSPLRGCTDVWTYERCTPLRKPEGLPSELADVFIRMLDYCAAFKEPLTDGFYGTWHLQEGPTVTPTIGSAWINELHKCVAAYDMQMLLIRTHQLADIYGIDLDAAVLLKHEYNKTREFRHGGKTI
jgi:hypothetical protein